MSSHNSAIASRTDVPRVASRTVTMQRCRNWAVVLYPFAYSSNASLLYLCKIIYNRPGVAFSQSPNHFCHLHQRIHLSHSCRISVLTTWMLCLPMCFFEKLLCAYRTCLYEFYFKVNLFGFKYRHALDLSRK